MSGSSFFNHNLYTFVPKNLEIRVLNIMAAQFRMHQLVEENPRNVMIIDSPNNSLIPSILDSTNMAL